MAVADTQAGTRFRARTAAHAQAGRARRDATALRPIPLDEAIVPSVSRGAKAMFAGMGLLLAGYAVLLAVRHTGDNSDWLDGWGVATFELASCALVLLQALRSRRDRAFGLWLGLGMLAWAAGDYAMTAESLNGADPGTLSVANILWYGFYPMSYLGVTILMRRDVRRFTVAQYLDGVVGSLVVGCLFAAFAFDAIVTASGGDSQAAAVNVVYPLGDLLLLALVGLPLLLLPRGHRGRWCLLAAACVANASGDFSALFPGIVDHTHIGYWLDALAWPTSLYLIAAGVWLTPSTTRAPREEADGGFVVPAVAALLSLLVLSVGSIDHVSRGALLLATAAMAGAGIRAGLALRRLRALTDSRHEQLADAAAAERSSRQALQQTVRQLSEFAARVADGDLTATATATVAARDAGELAELAQSLNRMVAGLAEISREIQAGVGDMGVSTADILAAVSDHTESAAVQSVAIHQISSTVEELRAAAEVISGKADEVAQRARASLQVSDQGTAAVASISEAMQEIRQGVDGIAADIRRLSDRTEQIGEITDTVNALADRSNLLALNASIEAARAGEHGRGFAVVADQVRHLAEQSRAATAQVGSILGDIRTATAAAVQASQHGDAVVAQGLDLAHQAGEGIRSLSDTIRSASESAEDIAASAGQQSHAMVQIVETMQGVRGGTEQFVAGARRSQQAAEALQALSERLAKLSERYRL
jgi:methyl-accepting chemotaxis protein